MLKSLKSSRGELIQTTDPAPPRRAGEYLEKLGVEVNLNTRVLDYDGGCLKLSDHTTLSSRTVIWAAGIKANPIKVCLRRVLGLKAG